MKFTLLFVFLLWFIGLEVCAQRKKSYLPPKIEELPQYPIDTIRTKDPDTRIILYSNNTWVYYRPHATVKLNEFPTYQDHWDTTQLFAYKSISLQDIPNVVDLELVSDLNQFHSPIQGNVLSKFGPRHGRNHNGVDIPLHMYEPIYATFEGKIRYAKYNTGGYGNLVIVRHKNGLETWYAHLSRTNVKVSDYVKAGQIIGFGGSTGRSRGPHLHFEMRYCDQTFDPEFIVDFSNGHLRYQTFALERSYFNIHSRASEILDEEEEANLPLLATNSSDSTAHQVLQSISKKQSAQKKSTQKTTQKTVYHTVRSGDVLGKIAARYGVSIDQICRLNNIKRTTLLRLSKKLRIK